MTIIDSNVFYTDFLSSDISKQFFTDDERTLLTLKINSIYNDFYEKEDYYQSGEYKNIKSAKDISEDLENNDKLFIYKLELLDELLCLNIYTKNIDTSHSIDAIEGVKNQILQQLSHPVPNDNTFHPSNLRKKLKKWRKCTSHSSFTSSPYACNEDDSHLDKAIGKASLPAKYALKLNLFKDNTVNNVYELPKERSFHGIRYPSQLPVAILKGCSKNDNFYALRQYTPMLEVVMYEVACMLKFDGLFTPTKYTEILTDGPTYSGCIQPYIHGKSLTHILEDDGDIDYTSYIDAFAASIIMGMGDAHCGNIIIDNDGLIKFFDNSRSLPHSNGVIRRSRGQLLPSYRNSLLCESYTFTPISETAKLAILSHVKNAQKCTIDLHKYLLKALDHYNFPEFWFDTKQIMKSYNERVQSLETQLQNSTKMTTPIDLIFAIDPIYQLYTGLMIAYKYSKHGNILFDVTPHWENPPDEVTMSELFYTLFNRRFYTFDELITYCSYSTISPKVIWNLCNQDLKWDDWLLNILDYVDETDEHEQLPIGNSKLQASIIDYDILEITELLNEVAQPDFKDPCYKDQENSHPSSSKSTPSSY